MHCRGPVARRKRLAGTDELYFVVFFFNHTPPTEIYTLSLHDALPISEDHGLLLPDLVGLLRGQRRLGAESEEHTSELQSLAYLVCRLLLEKKKTKLPILVPASL